MLKIIKTTVLLYLTLIMAPISTLIAQDSSAVNFADHVAPIIYNNCVECHRPGSIAPMTLIDYETVRAWGPVIKDRVEKRKMPPYFIDKGVGVQSFEDDRSLTDQEIATISAWVDAGSPRGDLGNMPPVPQFEDNVAWTLQDEMGRPPDLIIPIPFKKSSSSSSIRSNHMSNPKLINPVIPAIPSVINV